MVIRVGSWSEHLFEILNMRFLMYVGYDNIYIDSNMLFSKEWTDD